MYLLGRVWNTVVRVIAWCSAIAIIVMVSLTVIEVVGRKFFGFSVAGTVEIVSALLVVAGFSAWAYTQSQQGHVKVEFVVERLSATTRLVLEICITLVMLGVFAIMLWQTTIYAFDSLHPLKVFDSARIPEFPFRLLVPVGIFLISLQMLVQLVPKVYRLLPFSRGRLTDTVGEAE